MEHNSRRLRDALNDIIAGKTVKRGRHELLLNGRDVTGDFINALTAQGYYPATVRDIRVEPGERLPAFYLENGVAYFGWVFWERFTERKMRKLYGSVHRNAKGDWAVQLPEARPVTIFVNQADRYEMDIDHPSSW